MMCKSGYDVRSGSPFYEMIVCGDSGEWFLTGGLPLPDCAGNHNQSTESPEKRVNKLCLTTYLIADTVDCLKD